MFRASTIVLRLLLPIALAQPACGKEATAATAASDPIPVDLGTVEAAAEGLFDGALADDKAKVASSSKQIADALAAYRGHAAKDGVSVAVLADLETAASTVTGLVQKGSTGVELARAGNAISAPMSKIYGVYGPPLPVVMLDLDYLGREVLLDAREKSFARAGTDADRIVAIWAPFRPRLVAAGGIAVAADYEGAVANAKKAIAAADPVAIEAAAKAGLDHVDAMENVFKNQPPPADPGD